MREAKAIQKRGGLPQAIVSVDGRRNKREEDVRLWGEIVYVAGMGPVAEAVRIAHDFATMAAGGAFKAPTGHYASQFAWFMNGDAVGSEPPDVKRMGVKGNVQLVNRAPYASVLEILMPDGILYGAYNLLRRTFGTRLRLVYGYAMADAFGGQVQPSGRTVRPMSIPFLLIGNPISGSSRHVPPGVNRRRRALLAKRGRK
jgi:hypothetical protein